MIKFFRKIRQNLLKENKTGKYFKYAIGEIILVVIGILIALQINNWNENRKKINQSYIALIELKDEVADTKKIIEEKNNANTRITDLMKKYLEGKIVNPNDSLKNRIIRYSFAYIPIQLSIPIIEREVSADKFIIGQDSLLKELQEFKNLHITANQQLFYLDNFWNSNVTSFLEEQKLMLSFVSLSGKIDVKTQGLEILYDSDEFKNIIAMEYLHVDEYTQSIAKLYEQLEKIESQLSVIIEKNR